MLRTRPETLAPYRRPLHSRHSRVMEDISTYSFQAHHCLPSCRVPAFSSTKAKCLIEKELGGPVDELFKEFEDQPITAASLGHVHRAILHNGEKVVVKVQRPGFKKLFEIDLRVLKLIAEYFFREMKLFAV